ncbi:MAG: polysaccharide deacetylase family protein [Acidobacteria bacterium]|nr:polysaccharide deacetylase family protein [Acidobacteriota bacterium]
MLRRLKARVAPAGKRLLFGAGAYGALRKLRPSRGLAILRYHAVCGPEGHEYADPSICVSPAAFEQHVAYLASNYSVLPLPEAVERLRADRPLPPNAVSVTFDDGYADNLPAARVLTRYGVGATFYITAGCLSGEAPFWPSEIRELVARIQSAIRLTSAGSELTIPCATAAERQAAIRTLARLFKSNRISVREALRDELRKQGGGAPTSSPMLTWDELREMHRLGMIVGAHTVTHPNLPSAGPADARQEIAGSKARLEQELDARVTMFSYPNGGAERYMTRAVAGMVREAGFAAATTSWNGFAGPASDLYALERVQVSERLEDLVFALEVERFAFKPAARAVAPQ